MQGFSPKLPLTVDSSDGLYTMNKTALESIKQDLKMLLLTNPGERMMMPSYGVGLRKYLFNQNTQETKKNIKKAITFQVSRYMKFINIINLEIYDVPNNENAINIKIEYNVDSIRSKQELNLSLSSN